MDYADDVSYMITPQFLADLEEKAKKATPGDRRYIPGDSYCAYSHVIIGEKTMVLEDHHDSCCEKRHSECCGYPDDGQDASFIALCSPENILAMIERIRELENPSIDMSVSREQPEWTHAGPCIEGCNCSYGRLKK